MTEGLGKKSKKDVLKEIIRGIHNGMPLEQAKEKFLSEAGSVTSLEIASLEQSLIDDGMDPSEIKKFCNVHALLFEASLENTMKDPDSPSHPVNIFKKENRELEKLAASLKSLTESEAPPAAVKALVTKLLDVEKHYTRKEQLLFPYLEKQGFMGPSKVMWGKDNEIRDLFKATLAALKATSAGNTAYREPLNKLLEEILGMIFKEENILFPTALEKLSASEWEAILRESPDIGYCFIRPPEEVELLGSARGSGVTELRDNKVKFPSGELSPDELQNMLNGLPLDITFVGADGTVKYFSENAERIFVRTRAVLGRKVENCHPPKSIDRVLEIVNSFREGKRNSASFWLTLNNRFIHITFIALRDAKGDYLGTVELTQDLTGLRALTGERRLLDEGN